MMPIGSEVTRIALRTALLVTLLSGCSDGVVDEPPIDAGVTDAGGSVDAGALPVDAGTLPVDAGSPPADAGVTFDQELAAATPLSSDGVAIEGVIDPAGDVDDYRIDGIAGQFLQIQVRRVLGSRLDPVASLFDASGTLVAENDDQPGEDSRSSEIVYRVLADGAFLLRVQDWRSWAPEPGTPPGGPDYDYLVSVAVLDTANDGEHVAVELGDDAASAERLDLIGPRGLLAGAFDRDGDVDVFRIEVTRDSAILVDFFPSGPTGSGGTARPLNITVTSTDGTTLYGLADLDEADRLGAPVRAGTYLLWVAHPGGGLGANDFYAMAVRQNRFTWIEEPRIDDNDDLTTTASVSLNTDRFTNVLGNLPIGDVDVFSFELPPEVGLVIGLSRRWGTGLEGLTIEVLQEDGTPVGTGVETLDLAAGVSLENLAVARYFLRVSKVGQLPDNPLDFYIIEFF